LLLIKTVQTEITQNKKINDDCEMLFEKLCECKYLCATDSTGIGRDVTCASSMRFRAKYTCQNVYVDEVGNGLSLL